MKRAGVVTITFEALSAMLRLPVDHRVTHVLPQGPAEIAGDLLRFVVEGPSLQELPEGSEPQRLAIEIDGRTGCARFDW